MEANHTASSEVRGAVVRTRRREGVEHDPKGLGLMDEFSDCISADIAEGFDGDTTVQSITPLPDRDA